jgi:citrate lyase subunit beta/citryl-CoA lyase
VNLLRSFLFVPGHHPRRIAKAFDSAADAVIIDLEDAVPPAEKRVARENAAAALGDRGAAAAFVRVNGAPDPGCLDDLLEVVRPGLAGIVLPKAESAAQLQALDWAIGQIEARHGLPPGAIELVPLVESARGVEEALVMAGSTARVRRMTYGVADYSLDLGLQADPQETGLSYLRARLVHASRACGLEAPIDSVVVEIRDPRRLRESALRARALGFGGKLCLHPDQVPVVNEVFGPTAEELARARAVVAAYDEARARGEAAVTVDGSFVDAPVAEKARKLLQRAE